MCRATLVSGLKLNREGPGEIRAPARASVCRPHLDLYHGSPLQLADASHQPFEIHGWDWSAHCVQSVGAYNPRKLLFNAQERVIWSDTVEPLVTSAAHIASTLQWTTHSNIDPADPSALIQGERDLQSVMLACSWGFCCPSSPTRCVQSPNRSPPRLARTTVLRDAVLVCFPAPVSATWAQSPNCRVLTPPLSHSLS